MRDNPATRQTTADLEDKFISRLLDDIRHKRIGLPTLPEVAWRVRKAAQEQGTTATQLSKLISTDAALCTRLLQVANSPLYKGTNAITNVQTAIARLGQRQVKNLITSVVVSQLFQAQAPPMIRHRLKTTWAHTIQVAAISHVFARKFTRLMPEQAMLAGLIHDIGKLPILAQIELFPELLEDEKTVDRLVALLHPQIGKIVLETWNFPPEMVAVAAEHENLERNSRANPDYTDVVLMANLLSHSGNQQIGPGNWPSIPACHKLGLSPNECLAALNDAHDEVMEIQKLLTG
ncbi:MAG: HDOD domain-containing protein [Gammaproteobacteria bacterium]|nr:HDOD domain-containing protein [Gammaproteobacteria bacterium]